MPGALADHCDARLAVYGRSSLSPQPVPPYTLATQGICPSTNGATSAEHTLPPNADQVFVRVNGDFGPSIRTVRVELDGLGFADSSFVLERTANPTGGFTYQTREWLWLPAPTPNGELLATAFYPSATMSVRYQSAAVALPVPQAPPPSFAVETVEGLISSSG